MLQWSTTLVFLAAAFGLLVVPGPAVLYITSRGIAHGRRAGLASVLGIELASFCHSVAAAFGLSAILVTSLTAFSIVKYLGAAYLVFLGIRTIVSKSGSGETPGLGSPSLARLFRKGFLVNLLNPKTALFFYAFLPQFVDPARGSPVVQILALGGLFVALATLTDSAYALLSSHLGSMLQRWTPFRQARRYVTGGIYLCLGIGAAMGGATKE